MKARVRRSDEPPEVKKLYDEIARIQAQIWKTYKVHCPSEIAKRISESSNPYRSTSEAGANLKRFAEAAGGKAERALDAMDAPEASALFMLHPEAFIRIAGARKEERVPKPGEIVQVQVRRSGQQEPSVFDAFEKPEFRRLFEQNPDALAEIAVATGGDLSAFLNLCNPAVSRLFSKNPVEFVEIARATGESAASVFRAFSNPTASKFLPKTRRLSSK